MKKPDKETEIEKEIENLRASMKHKSDFDGLFGDLFGGGIKTPTSEAGGNTSGNTGNNSADTANKAPSVPGTGPGTPNTVSKDSKNASGYPNSSANPKPSGNPKPSADTKTSGIPKSSADTKTSGNGNKKLSTDTKSAGISASSGASGMPSDISGKTPAGSSPSDNPLITSEELSAFLDSYGSRSEQDALAQATDALKEAREMLSDLTMDLLGSITDDPKVQSSSAASAGSARKDGSVYPSTLQGAKAVQDSNGKTTAQEASKSPEEPETDPMEELDALIGLTTIKKDVKELADFVTIQKMRKDLGMKSVPVSLHLVFTGNPGTGKTTVARILSKIYKKIGVLSKGQLVEVDRSGLVAGYVGQTALKTQERIKEALGGILFIDEAYSLAQKDDAFGQEAIDTILKAMEDNRDDLVVIVAGYTGPMEKFINSNPGLKSRFNKYIEFPDYTLDELEAIFNLSCKKYDYHPDEDATKQIREILKLRMITRHENFANAREARNLFEEIVTNQARRVAAIKNPTQEQITTILVEDLYEAEEAPIKTEEADKAPKKTEEDKATKMTDKKETSESTKEE